MSADDPGRGFEGEGPPLIGRTVANGRYEVLAFLGAGGMGAVYRAMQHPLERLVALKLIHRDFASDPAVIARFEREMRVTASIEHPHTVRVYDYGQIDGQPFLAMEFLGGRTLRDELASAGAFPVARLAHIGTQIAKALRAAHGAGIIHRDLKPENVMLLDSYGEQDFVKVLDFGIARPLREDAGYRTAAGVLVGTPTYMSPEQASDVPVDPRSDLYTLGVMLYEMAAGAPPFRGTALTALLYAHASQPPPPLRERAAHLPAELEQLVMRLLEKSPNARPANADEVVAALAPFVSVEAQQWPTPGGGRAQVPAGWHASGAPTKPEHAGAATLPTELAGQATPSLGQAPRPGVGGTIALPPHTGRAEDVTASRDQVEASSSRRRLLLTAGGVIVAAAIAAGVLLKGHGGGSVGSDPRPGAGGASSAKQTGAGATGTSGAPPTTGLAIALAPLLAMPGEPPWPAACRTVAAEPAGLREAATGAAVPRAPASARAAVVTALPSLGEVPERWLVAARLASPDDLPAATAAARAAVKACPSSAVAFNLLGNALQRQKVWTDAAAAYAEASRLAPDYRAPAFNAGLVALRAGDSATALRTFDALAAAAPDHPGVFLVRAEALRQAGRDEEALRDLQEHTRRHPDSTDGWVQLGRALVATKRPGATEAFCRASELGDAEASTLCHAKPGPSRRRR